MKKIFRYSFRFLLDIIQVLGVFLLILMQVFPMTWASNLAAFFARHLFSRLRISKRAYTNLKLAMPELSQAEQEKIIIGMWENLARTIVEYVFLSKVNIYETNSRVEVIGTEIIDKILNEGGGPAILFLGHLAHWEIGTMAGTQRGLKITQLIRPINYPLTNKLIRYIHDQVAQEVTPKGPQGARKMLETLERGGVVSALLDQKLREGDNIPFFSMLAKTPSALARLSLKYKCPYIPVQVERLPEARFRVTYHSPLKPRIKGTLHQETEDLLVQMNEFFEKWIRQHPEQWLWLHRRWPKEIYKNLSL